MSDIEVPEKFVFLNAAQLPTTPTGKVQKFRLVQMATSAAEDAMEGSGV